MNNHNHKLLKIYVAGMITTAAVGLGAVLLIPKINEINQEYSPRLSLSCRLARQAEKEEWNDLCLRRNYQNIDQKLFEKIEQRRIRKLEAAGCDPDDERWYCDIDYQTNRYRPLFYE